MDLSDTSKLLRIQKLNETLEALSCNEDSNAIDSIYTKSTTLEVEEISLCSNAIFGESIISSLDESFGKIFRESMNSESSDEELKNAKKWQKETNVFERFKKKERRGKS